MTKNGRTSLEVLSTGVPGLDDVLGGGLPEYSFNLIAGSPGTGKTTLVHQIVFANATPARPAIYFTVLGEPSMKMLRYQQQMEFFDPEMVGTSIRFIDLSEAVLQGDLESVLVSMVAHVTEASAAFVVVDSFRTLMSVNSGATAEATLQAFLRRLALYLASWQVTSFLVGEYCEEVAHDNSVFTIADGIVMLARNKERNSTVRKLEVTKIRGLGPMPGLHTFQISSRGLHVYPRMVRRMPRAERGTWPRMSIGVADLDEMLGGGIPFGDATLVAGPSGTGKTVLCGHFLAEARARGESCVVAIFEEHPDDYLARARDMGFELDAMVAEGKLRVVTLHMLDVSADEIFHYLQRAVREMGAARLVLDSLNGLELALAPSFREEFRESLYRMIGLLTGDGVNIMLTVEVSETFDQIRFSPHSVSFLAQNILFLRYVELDGRLRKVLTIVKMRRSAHSVEFRAYEITGRGIRMDETLADYHGILTGVPTRRTSNA